MAGTRLSFATGDTHQLIPAKYRYKQKIRVKIRVNHGLIYLELARYKYICIKCINRNIHSAVVAAITMWDPMCDPGPRVWQILSEPGWDPVMFHFDILVHQRVCSLFGSVPWI
jgi:hypothetical protein